MACLVLHNLLHSIRDDETWLQEDIELEGAANNIDGNQEEQEQESNVQAKRAGITRRDELRNLVASLQV